jgi:rSAM/selenodomain-associated transferase 1
VVFGREPVAGRVKTRLAAGIGEDAAARVYAVLLDRTLEIAASVKGRVILSLAEKPTPSWAEGLRVPYEVQLGRDLGERMATAFERRFHEGDQRVVVVGSDCAGATSRHITGAILTLDWAQVVLGPVRDGGYWLVAQKRPGVDLFTGIPWSSAATLSTTRERLAALGVTWAEIETLDDIDTEADLRACLGDSGADQELNHRLRVAIGD